MTPQEPLLLADKQPGSRELHSRLRRPRSCGDTAQLVLAAVMLAVLAGLIYVSELDSVYWTNVRITSFVQHALGIHRPVDDGGSAARARRVIVVAENDEGQRLIAKTTLERYGYAVALADDGAQAEALLRKAGPRVALMVLDRQAMRDSADEAIRRLRSIQPDLRILMSQTAGEDAVVTDLIESPFNSVLLAEAVRRALAVN